MAAASITDWGVHLTQVALWYLNAERVGPLLTSGSAQYVNYVNPDRDQSPDAFVVSWQYPEFVMSFTNTTVQDWEFGRQGNYFFGPKGSLLIHRQGYEVRSASNANPKRVPTPAGDALSRRRSAMAQVRWMARTMIRSVRAWPCFPWTRSNHAFKPSTDLEVGFYASLPCILAVKAIREGKCFKWDDAGMKAVAV